MKYEYWLAALRTLSSRRRIQAAAFAGGARSLYEMPRQRLEKSMLFQNEELERFLAQRQAWELDGEWERFAKTDMRLVTCADIDYPEALRHIYQPPYGLFVKGRLPASGRSVAIVGARMCSEYGRSMAMRLAGDLAKRGVQVISGLALGVDSASHAGALQARGATFAVLGCGCDICYPKSSLNLYHNMIENGGGVISEYPPGTQPMPYFFPERNRLISGLSDTVVIVEAKEKSGSLITADFALEQGRDIYAVPGRYDDALSRGCNRLIAQGAGILYDIDSFMESLGIDGKSTVKFTKTEQVLLEKDEKRVYSCLGLHPKFINNIIEETGLDLLCVLRALDQLKTRGLIRESFQNYYCKR